MCPSLGLFNFTPDSNGVTVQDAVTPIVQGSILAQASAACAAGGATGSAITACAQAALAAKTADGTVATQVTAVAARIYGPATPLAAHVGYLHSNPRTTYLNGQQTAEDALVFPYQMFVISLLIGAWCIGQNFYARLRDDRVGNFVAWTTFTVMCAGWWLMLWPIAYAFAFSEGQGQPNRYISFIDSAHSPFGSMQAEVDLCSTHCSSLSEHVCVVN